MDPLKAFERRDCEREEKLNHLPVCCECGLHIQQDRALRLATGEWMCDSCIDNAMQDVESEAEDGF